MWAATVGGGALVAVPYAGLGWLDIGWASAAGGSAALAVLRWRDFQALKRQPIPLPSPAAGRTPLAPILAPVLAPVLAAVAERPRRLPVRRGSLAGPAAARLNRATRALAGLLDRLGRHAGDTAREAAGAHATLRDLAVRVMAVEKALPVAPPASRDALQAARAELVGQLTEGVEAYERLTAAAAECVAALAHGGDNLAVARLTEAAEALSGLAQGLAELRDRRAG